MSHINTTVIFMITHNFHHLYVYLKFNILLQIIYNCSIYYMSNNCKLHIMIQRTKNYCVHISERKIVSLSILYFVNLKHTFLTSWRMWEYLVCTRCKSDEVVKAWRNICECPLSCTYPWQHAWTLMDLRKCHQNSCHWHSIQSQTHLMTSDSF